MSPYLSMDPRLDGDPGLAFRPTGQITVLIRDLACFGVSSFKIRTLVACGRVEELADASPRKPNSISAPKQDSLCSASRES